MDYDNEDLALLAIEKELEKDPANWEAWAAKADILYSLRIFETAIRCCDKSLSLNPYNSLTRLTKCKVLDKLGRHGDAVICLEKTKMQIHELESRNWIALLSPFVLKV